MRILFDNCSHVIHNQSVQLKNINTNYLGVLLIKLHNQSVQLKNINTNYLRVLFIKLHNQLVQLKNIDINYLRVLFIKVGNLKWIILDKNKHDFSEQIRDQNVTEKEIHCFQDMFCKV